MRDCHDFDLVVMQNQVDAFVQILVPNELLQDVFLPLGLQENPPEQWPAVEGTNLNLNTVPNQDSPTAFYIC